MARFLKNKVINVTVQLTMKKTKTPQHRGTEIHRGKLGSSPFFLCASVFSFERFSFFKDYRSGLNSNKNLSLIYVVALAAAIIDAFFTPLVELGLEFICLEHEVVDTMIIANA